MMWPWQRSVSDCAGKNSAKTTAAKPTRTKSFTCPPFAPGVPGGNAEPTLYGSGRRFLAFGLEEESGGILGDEADGWAGSARDWNRRNYPQDIQSVDLPDALHQRYHGPRVRLHEVLEIGRILQLERRSCRGQRLYGA